MTRVGLKTLLAGLWLAGSMGAARADEIAPTDRTISLQLENDAFSQFFGLADSDATKPDFNGDRYYTQGFRLGLSVKADGDLKPFDWIGKIGDFVLKDREGKAIRVTKQYFLGQNIYTPKDITIAGPQPDDRPYAGWLYLGGAISRQTKRSFETIELDVGVIGPVALGKQVQSTWHSLIGELGVETRTPKGWDNQLRNEPAFVLNYMLAHQILSETLGSGESGFGFDLTPHMGAALGTVYTYASVGGTVRLGTGRDREIVTPNRIQPSMPGSDFYPEGKLAGYVFAGLEGRAVARNAFLDGNLFRESLSVEKRHFVADIALGGVVFMGEWRVAYTQTFRAEEFHGQKGGEFFGALSVTRRF